MPVNQRFADAVLDELDRGPGATVFFHDYHLYVAPGMVAAGRPEATLAHFVHVPWAQPDYWRVLPEPIRRAIHEGILANDVVGFHTDRWRRNFLRCCVDIPGAAIDISTGTVRLGERRSVLASLRSRSTRSSSSARPERARARRGGGDRVLAVRVPAAPRRSHGSVEERRPRLRRLRAVSRGASGAARRVAMLALLDPSRQDIPEYAEYLGAIQRAARVVNDRFQRNGWLPLDLQIQDNFPQAVAAYKQFDVLLVNAIFDGMNLVAKEAPLVNERDGVLVLSENAGVHDELAPWALTVNPFDVAGQAEAIYEALTMPAEERRRRSRGSARRCARARHRGLDRAAARRRRRGRRGPQKYDSGRERRLSEPRRRVGGGPDGRRGVEAAVAPPCRGRGSRRHGPRRLGRFAPCRRVMRSRPRRSPGSWRPSAPPS